MLLQKTAEKLEELNKEFSSCLSDMDLDTLNIQPSENSWSIMETLDHILIGNRYYLIAFEQLLQLNYPSNFFSKLPFLSGFWGKIILKSVSPANQKKVKTMPVFSPESSRYTENLLPQLLEVHTRISQLILQLEDYHPKKTKLTSPAGKVITYSLEDALNIMVDHTERHLNQIKRIKEELKTVEA